MLRCMRTTITIDDHLLDEVRRRATERRQTVSQVIEDSIRESLLRHHGEPAPPFTVRPVHAGGTQRGVDLDDNAALLALMNDEG
jgi:Bacterial antitoxin of type II TA system, VapB